MMKMAEALNRAVALFETMQAELYNDRICGCWVGLDSNRTVTIRKVTDGFIARIYENNRCHKIFEAEIRIESFRRRLRFWDGPRQFYVHYLDNDTLTFGCYGRFVPENRITLPPDTYETY